MIYKKCIKCGQIKSLELFHKAPSNKDGRNSECKKCCHFRLKIQRRNPIFKQKFKEYQRNSIFKFRYGITTKEFEKMVKKQKNKCIICNEEPKKTKAFQTWNLHIDHCHKSKKIRGLLCHLCNRGLGLFKDDINLLKKAVKYLKKHN